MFQYYQDRVLIHATDDSTKDKIRIDFDTNAKSITLQKNGQPVGTIQLS